jgi:hypothetical protein
MSRKKETPFFERYVRYDEHNLKSFPTASLRKMRVRCSLCGEKLPKYPVGVWVEVIDGVEYFKAPMTSCVFLCVECRDLPGVEKYLIQDSYSDLQEHMDKYCERIESVRSRHNIEYGKTREVSDE